MKPKRTIKPKAKRDDYYYPDIPKKRVKTREISRSAKTGRTVSKKFAKTHKSTTVTEIIPIIDPLDSIAPLVLKAETVLTNENLPVEERLGWSVRFVKAIKNFIIG